MHIVKPYQTAVTLFKRNGDVVVFSSMQAALRRLGFSWIAANVGPHFCTFSHHLYVSLDGRVVRNREEIGGIAIQRPVYVEHDYVMRDDRSNPLTAESFVFLRVRHSGSYTARLFRYWNGVGPVPGTGKQTGTHHFRNIRYINAKRVAQYFLEEGEPVPRAARNVKCLPDSWDDMPIAARSCRNWKRYRKIQWH
jgi:hypothetical protein